MKFKEKRVNVSLLLWQIMFNNNLKQYTRCSTIKKVDCKSYILGKSETFFGRVRSSRSETNVKDSERVRQCTEWFTRYVMYINLPIFWVAWQIIKDYIRPAASETRVDSLSICCSLKGVDSLNDYNQIFF